MFDLNWVFVLVDELKCGRGLSGFCQGKSSEAQAGPRFVAAGTNTFLIFFVYEYRVGACIHVYRYIPGSCMILQGSSRYSGYRLPWKVSLFAFHNQV